MYANFDQSCLHPYIIEDQRTGDEICQDCGKITSDLRIIFLSQSNAAKHVHFTDDDVTPNVDDEDIDSARPKKKGIPACKTRLYHCNSSIKQSTLDILTTVCASYHVTTDIKKDAIMICASLNSKSFLKITDQCKAAYAMYIAFTQHDVTRGIDEIAAMFHVTPKEIYSLCKKHDDFSVINVKCSSLASRICTLLNIVDFKVKKNLAEIADKMQIKYSSIFPQVIFACVLYSSNCSSYLTIHEIAYACNTTVQTIRRSMKNMKNDIATVKMLTVEQPITTAAAALVLPLYYHEVKEETAN